MSLQQVWQELADALEPLTTVVDGLQVYGFWNDNPTPPSLDVYPGDPFQDGSAFGVDQSTVYFTVRLRVGTADLQAAQLLLLRMLDPADAASVEAALAADDTAYVVPEGVSGFREYGEDSGSSERMLGCEWRVRAFT